MYNFYTGEFMHIRIGEMEYTSMDKDFKELIETILYQHNVILEFNKTLIENLAKPMLYAPKKEE